MIFASEVGDIVGVLENVLIKLGVDFGILEVVLIKLGDDFIITLEAR